MKSMFSHPGFFPDPDQTFFPESGSAKVPDPIRKNPDPENTDEKHQL